MNGDPPAGCPYEAGADTSKIAMGGLLGQAATPGGKLRVLMYWSAPLSPAQSQWHPFEQEFLANVSTRIINEVKGINRVTYDITSKPPGTIEWE